jgi:hypothetical protein
MLFGAFQPPKPDNRILVRYTLDGLGYIFSCTVIIFHPQVCARSLNSGWIVGMRLSFFARRPASELFFPSDGCANIFLAFKVERALAAIGRMFHDTKIQVARGANVKRARMAAENADVGARPVRLGGRKAPNCMGKISTAEVLRLRAKSAVSRNQCVRRSAQDDDSLGV